MTRHALPGRRVLPLLIAALLLVVPQVAFVFDPPRASAAVVVDDGAAYQGGVAHDGHSSTLIGRSPVLRWDRVLPGRLGYPVIAEGRVHVLVAGLALAAAHGLDLLLKHRPSDARRLGLLTAAAVGGAVALLWTWTAVFPGAWVPPKVGDPTRFLADLRQLWVQGAVLGVAFFGLGLVAVAAAARDKPAWSFAVPVLAALELLNANPVGPWLLPASYFTEPAALCQAIRAAGGGYGRSRVTALLPAHPDLISPIANGERYLGRAVNLMEPDAGGLCGVEGTSRPNLSGQSARTTRAVTLLKREELARLFNVGFRVIDSTVQTTSGEIVGHYEWFALERAPTLPRAYAAEPLFVEGEAAALRAVVRSRGDLDGKAVLEGEPPAAADYGPLHDARVEIESYAPEEVVLKVRLQRDAAVVLNDAWREGWTAELDGREVPILRANYLVRAVLAPPGEHQIRFTFEMPYLKAGISLAAIALLISALVFLRERRRSGNPASPTAT